MTKQAKKIKEAMLSDFLHWAKYNPTIVKEKFGVSDLSTLQNIIKFYVFK